MLPAPVVAPIAPAAWHALVAVGAAADATLAVPRADLVAALAAALDDDDARAAQRAFDAFDDAARGARMASHTTLALLPRPPGAAAVAPLSLAAALLRRGALAGADVTDVHTCAEARALVRAARATSSSRSGGAALSSSSTAATAYYAGTVACGTVATSGAIRATLLTSSALSTTTISRNSATASSSSRATCSRDK